MLAVDGEYIYIPSVSEIRHEFKGVLLCEICGEELDTTFSIDHNVPIIRGGSNELQNLLATHYRCNQIKGSLNLIQVRAMFATLESLEIMDDRAIKDIKARLIAGGARRYGK